VNRVCYHYPLKSIQYRIITEASFLSDLALKMIVFGIDVCVIVNCTEWLRKQLISHKSIREA